MRVNKRKWLHVGQGVAMVQHVGHEEVHPRSRGRWGPRVWVCSCATWSCLRCGRQPKPWGLPPNVDSTFPEWPPLAAHSRPAPR